MMKRTILLLIGAWLCFAVAAAQTNDTPKLAQAQLSIFVLHQRPPVDIRNKSEQELREMMLSPDAGRLNRWIRTGAGPDDFQQISGDENLLSLPFSYRGPLRMVFYKRIERPGEPPAYMPREEVSLPPKLRTGVLLAIRTGGTDEDPEFQLGLIDCSQANPDSMGVLFYNYAKVPLIIRIGKNNETVSLQPSARKWTPLDQERASVPLKIAAFDQEWKLVYNTVSRLSTQRPTLGLILPQDKTKIDSIRLLLLTLPKWPGMSSPQDQLSAAGS